MQFVAYTAGYVDADGSILILLNARTRVVPSLIIQVSITSKDERPLLKIQEEFGGVCNRDTKAYGSTGSLYYRYSANGATAYDMLVRIKPYLLMKHEQAGLAMHAYDVTQNQWAEGKANIGLRRQGISNYENPVEVRKVREDLHNQMKTLNQSYVGKFND